ncbi:DNA-binding transcriptional regulator, XRE-family HTH domain [Amphibacillus marinus]|uniref:DNA-binding transcriptional regulator, XRE-family HTH domain n=1 Tax=Amphibacillus marinus TaxID=872970 RepID=A0A1H8K3C4_9BACI|nr:helix-turn-helix transcriptional regulator [Amphibacillus marinus]SEN87026.1 DNA-binding transcriptional regulator, XRE-family HTH domain [Amphibacillus marinus]
MQVILKDNVKAKLMIAETGNSLGSFAKKVGISQGYLSQILSKKNNPSPKVAYKIANGLGVDIHNIFLIKVIDITIEMEV